MLKKLGLDQTKVYERCLALEEISKMLVSFVNGRPHHLSIGAEQGDIDKWDDLVIENSMGGYIHVQVKRQTTPFSSDSIIRDNYTKGANAGTPRRLSPLDETLKSLGKRINTGESCSKGLQKEFWLEVPEGSILIKDGLEIRNLRNFCQNTIKDITTADDMIALAHIDSNTNNIYKWLSTWCDFLDWEHILKAFKILKIKTSGLEEDIVARAKNNLSQIFKTTEIEQVRMLILSYLEENTTFAGAIKPRELLYLLKGYLLPNILRWTLFQTDGSSWNVSGIHDLEDNNEIERPSVIVPSLWAAGNPNARSLKIYGDCPENCLVSESLMRLSLHPQGSFDIHCSNKSSWKSLIRIKTGGTLGIARNDLNDSRMLDGLELCLPSEPKKVTTIDAKEELAEKLHNEMQRTTFGFVDSVILNKIREMKRSDLRTEVESRWISWKPSLESSVEEQRKLFSKILHPKAEGNSISGELRVGPKTVDLLSEAIFLLLVVSVCLGDATNQDWKSVTDKLKMTSVGLAYWSGPADGTRKVIEIDDEEGISKLLEKEPGQIIIIPQSELTDTEFFKDDISGDTTKRGLLTHPNYPKLLITKDRNFRKKLTCGIISELREYFQNSLDKYENIRESAINEVVR
jgi:hypothetical protein